MPVKRALRLSLNVPAIALLLDRVGRAGVVAPAAGRRQSGAADRTAPASRWTRRRRHDLAAPRRRHRSAAAGTTSRCARSWTRKTDEREPTRLMDQVAAWRSANVADRERRRPRTASAAGSPSRPDTSGDGDRDDMVGRLRWPHHHRCLGRPARWRAGSRPDRARRGGADPVRCL